MNPRQRRLRRQRRKDRDALHVKAVEIRHAAIRRSSRLAAQAAKKAAPITGGALLASTLAGLKPHA